MEVRLWESGPVVFPAYEATTAGLRQQYRDKVLEERTAWKRTAPSNACEPGRRLAMTARARAVELQEKSRRP
jgi:hypothetical protein